MKLPTKVVERREIDGEKAYPIYRLSAEFTEMLNPDQVKRRLFPERDAYPDKWRTPNEQKWGVPAHRLYNYVSGYKMVNDLLSPEMEAGYLHDFVSHYGISRPTFNLLRARIDLLYWETWSTGWFNHYTFPNGRTNEELVRSFDSYVNRHERYQESHNFMDGKDDGEHAVVLMGAEDRWRWRANPSGSGADEPDSIICRCEGCTKLGVVRISH